MELIYKELYLFYQSPKEYLYLFTYPKNKVVQIENYNPKITIIGETIMGMIKKIYPDLKVHFIGSAALGIEGQKDIDLFMECLPKNFNKYLPGLSALFGPPIKRRRGFIQWEVIRDDCNIELLLINPSESLFYKCVHDFEVIKNNKKYLDEYKRIKQESNGLSIREYQKRKLIFFDKIWSLRIH